MFFDAATDEVVLRIVYEGGDAEPRAMLTEVSRQLWVDRGEVSIDPSERLAHIEHTGGVVRGVSLRNQLVACSAASLGDEAFGDLIEQADALVLVGPWSGATKRNERLERLTRVLKKHRPRGSVVMPTTAEVVDHISTLALAAGDAWHGGNANDVKRASVEALRTTVRRLAADLRPERLSALQPLARAPLPNLEPPKPAEDAKVEAKSPAPAKPEAKNPEPKKPEANKPEPKSAEPKKPEPKKPEPKKIQPPRVSAKKKARSNATTTGPLPPPPVPGSARPTPRPRTTKPRPPKIRGAPLPAIPEVVTKSDSRPPIVPAVSDTSYNISGRSPRDKRKAPKTNLAALFEDELPSKPDDSGSRPVIAATAPPPEPEPTPASEPEPGAPAAVGSEVTPRLSHEVVDDSPVSLDLVPEAAAVLESVAAHESREPSVELKTRTLSEPGAQTPQQPTAVDSETAKIVQPAAVMSTPAPRATTALARTPQPETTISWWAAFVRWFMQLFGGKRSTQ